MTARPPACALSLRLVLFLAAVVLLPCIIALVATGVGGAPTSGLTIAETTGAFSIAALQGLDRRTGDGPTGSAALAAGALAPAAEDLRALEHVHAADPDTAQFADADARVLPLRL